jgi:hypothetical protein
MLCGQPLIGDDRSLVGSGERLLKDATDILVGQVVGQRSQKTDDGRMIFTYYTLRVDKAIKGDLGSTVEIMEYGGVVGDRATIVSDSPRYVDGRRYLVFASRDPKGRLRTAGGVYGLLPVIPEKNGRSVVRLYPGHPLTEVIPGRSSLRDLDELAGQLRALVSRTTCDK